MTNSRKFACVTSILLVCAPGIVVGNDEDLPPDAALLEFLASMPEESEDWRLFVELMNADVPPGLMEPELAEPDFVEKEND